jgi:hypothetical protein
MEFYSLFYQSYLGNPSIFIASMPRETRKSSDTKL